MIGAADGQRLGERGCHESVVSQFWTQTNASVIAAPNQDPSKESTKLKKTGGRGRRHRGLTKPDPIPTRQSKCHPSFQPRRHLNTLPVPRILKKKMK
jgi:hypothetical protein